MSWLEIVGLALAFFAGTGFGIGLLGLCQANRFEAERYGGYLDLSGTRRPSSSATPSWDHTVVRQWVEDGEVLRPVWLDLLEERDGHIQPGRKR